MGGMEGCVCEGRVVAVLDVALDTEGPVELELELLLLAPGADERPSRSGP